MRDGELYQDRRKRALTAPETELLYLLEALQEEDVDFLHLHLGDYESAFENA